MKRACMILLAVLMALSLCLSAIAEGGRRVAKEDVRVQTDDSTMPTRLPLENGTKILLHFGDTVIPGVLNDSETARALIARLPYTQPMSRYSHDFCGVTEDLPYQEDEVHYGWMNGDIDYSTDAPYFTILFDGQEESDIYRSLVNIGVITCPLEEIASLNGSYDVLIELDESVEAEPMMRMKIGDTPVSVVWEENESVDALKALVAGGLTIQMSMYGGFEQVGPIGQRLPSDDVQTSTSSGDIVLYSSNQLVVFYGSNSWAYTRLGHITDKTPEEMRELLGSGNVSISLTVE